jgi:hypothetical protein
MAMETGASFSFSSLSSEASKTLRDAALGQGLDGAFQLLARTLLAGGVCRRRGPGRPSGFKCSKARQVWESIPEVLAVALLPALPPW